MAQLQRCSNPLAELFSLPADDVRSTVVLVECLVCRDGRLQRAAYQVANERIDGWRLASPAQANRRIAEFVRILRQRVEDEASREDAAGLRIAGELAGRALRLAVGMPGSDETIRDCELILQHRATRVVATQREAPNVRSDRFENEFSLPGGGLDSPGAAVIR